MTDIIAVSLAVGAITCGLASAYIFGKAAGNKETLKELKEDQ